MKTLELMMVGLLAVTMLLVPTTALGQPTITTQPQSRTNIVGTTVTFSVETTNALPIFYQWQKKPLP